MHVWTHTDSYSIIVTVIAHLGTERGKRSRIAVTSPYCSNEALTRSCSFVFRRDDRCNLALLFTKCSVKGVNGPAVYVAFVFHIFTVSTCFAIDPFYVAKRRHGDFAFMSAFMHGDHLGINTGLLSLCESWFRLNLCICIFTDTAITKLFDRHTPSWNVKPSLLQGRTSFFAHGINNHGEGSVDGGELRGGSSNNAAIVPNAGIVGSSTPLPLLRGRS